MEGIVMAKRKKVRGTPKRAPKRTRAPKRAPKRTRVPKRSRPVLAPVPVEVVRSLTEEISLGDLGLAEIKLTDQEEAILSAPVNPADVLVLPTGQPYLSHPTYTRWLNRAFGRMGWSIVPASKPMKVETSVVVPYILYIHHKPVAFAHGEMTYHPTNKDQTFGDALEGTVASALRRCAKRLGIGLELWDKAWLNEWIGDRCIRVSVKQRDGKIRQQWRRKTDPKFPFEQSGGRAEYDQDEDRSAPAVRNVAPGVVTPAAPAARITDGQRRRLGVKVANSGRGVEEVRAWLERRYGWKGSAEITQARYDAICAAVEAEGALPEGRG